MTGLSLLLISLLSTCFLLSRIARRLLNRLHDYHHELAVSLITRRRLIAILFHDLANPLTAMELSLAMASRDPKKSPSKGSASSHNPWRKS